MIDLQKDLEILEEYAIKAARLAGDFIALKHNCEIEVMKKAGATSLSSQVFTAVDLQAQELILEVLSESRIRFDLGLLTEESEDDRSRLEKDFFWCIDPLDGTLAFLKNEDGFAVSIGLVSKNGHAVLGVAYDPMAKKMYSSMQPVREEKNQFLFAVDRGFTHHPLYPQVLKMMEKAAQEKGCAFVLKDYAGAVLNALWVSESKAGVYFKVPKKELGGGSLWDFAAITAYYHSRGDVALQFSSEPLHLNPEHTTFMNEQGAYFSKSMDEHAGLLQLLLKP